ncbi:hypothetical protein D3C75_1061660 [compost metagenome]
MQRDRHILRSAGNTLINQTHVILSKLLRIDSPATEMCTVSAAGKRTPGCIIQLKVTAPRIIEVLDCGLIHCNNVLIQQLLIGIYFITVIILHEME